MALAAVAMSLAIRTTRAQDAAAEAPPAAADDAKADDSVVEQSIYIPYEKLREVFEKHGRGVFLPYEEFDKLWKAARDKKAPADEQRPPVEALITEIENEATVEGDVVKVHAVLKIDILAEGWHEIPLRLANEAIIDAAIAGEPARIVGGDGKGYRLLVHKQGKQPEQIELTLDYAKAIEKQPGRNSVSLEAPRAPVSRWRVRIPQSGVKVRIHPMIAASEEPPAEPASADPPADPDATPPEPAAAPPEETVVRAFVGAAPTVAIEWTPKAEGATGLAALAAVSAQQQVWVHEGVTRTETTLDYVISRAELTELSIDVPADQQVVDVTDPNVRQWQLEPADPAVTTRRINVSLHQPAKETQQVVVELKKFTDGTAADVLQVPVVEAVGVRRQQGVVVVWLDEGRRAEAVETGDLIQLSRSELPGKLPSTDWEFCYRYARVPFDLQLRVEDVRPQITVDSLVEAYLEPKKLSLDVFAAFTVERAGVFQLRFDVPAGYRVRQVHGRAGQGITAAEIEPYRTPDAPEPQLIVNLRQKALGRVGLLVQLERDLDEPDLLEPTGNRAEIDVALPRAVAAPEEILENDTGRLVVFAPENLEVNPDTDPEKTAGLREIPVREALSSAGPLRAERPSDVRPVFARAYSREPVKLALGVKHRKPQVNIRQLLVARVDPGTVRYEATFFYNVLYSGVPSLRIDVPKTAEDEGTGWRNLTQSIRDEVLDTTSDAAIDDPPEGYEAWSFSGETELIGSGRIEMVWERKIQGLDVGSSVPLDVPRLIPVGADLSNGQIVLVKAETIDVVESDEADKIKGLQPIDHHEELMAGAQVDNAARAFEFHDDDWALSIVATMYELAEVKRTSIDRAVLRLVVTRAGEVSVQALYRIRSVRPRLEIKLPQDAKLDAAPAWIDGKSVTLQIEKSSHFVPLVDTRDDTPFLLELRYTVPGDGRLLTLPEFAEEPEAPAVQKVYLCVYLPEEEALLGTAGPWTDEFRWIPQPGSRWYAPSTWRWVAAGRGGELGYSLLDDAALIGWVHKGLNEPGTFEADGQLFVFSTLHPAAGDEGALRLKFRSRAGVSTFVFIALVLIGLVTLPCGMAQRVTAVGALLAALVLCGVFAPTMSYQIIDVVLAAAVFVVVVLWTAQALLRARRCPAEGPSSTPPPAESFTTPSEKGPDLGASGQPADGPTPAPPPAPSFTTPSEKGPDLAAVESPPAPADDADSEPEVLPDEKPATPPPLKEETPKEETPKEETPSDESTEDDRPRDEGGESHG